MFKASNRYQSSKPASIVVIDIWLGEEFPMRADQIEHVESVGDDRVKIFWCEESFDKDRRLKLRHLHAAVLPVAEFLKLAGYTPAPVTPRRELH